MSNKLIDNLRIALYVLLIFFIIILFQNWDKDHPKPISTTTTSSETPEIPQSATTNNYVPQLTNDNKSPSPAVAAPTVETAKSLIHVTTDVAKFDIDTEGGNIVSVELLKFPQTLHSDKPYSLLNDSAATRYIAQSGLLGANGPDTSKGQAIYSAEKTDYTLTDDQKDLQVKLFWKNAEGITVTKIYTFQRGSYEVGLDYQIANQSKQPWNANLYLQLMRKNTPPADKQGAVSFATFFGAAISSPEKAYEKISFKQMDSSNLNQTVTGGWAAMIQHYFVSAWIPDNKVTSQYFTRVSSDGMYTVGIFGPELSVNPGATVDSTAKFYAGPSIASDLEKASPGLQLTIDYGWLWFISVAIFWLMQKIYSVVGNWGWSIVLVTLLIKLMFYTLSAKSYRSMSGMKRLQPKLNELKEKFGEDKQKFTEATLALYRKEKVNPMSGCLPILIQIPVFIALYWVLIESVQLRQAPFILWIHDLSTSDPYFILPVLMGLSMFLQQRLNPPPPDPMQAKLMMLLPIVFTAMFAKFPAGLMLYWFVNNTLSFLQQWHIMWSMERADNAKKSK